MSENSGHIGLNMKAYLNEFLDILCPSVLFRCAFDRLPGIPRRSAISSQNYESLKCYERRALPFSLACEIKHAWTLRVDVSDGS